MDNSLSFADRKHDQAANWIASTKEKPWAKKMSGWFQQKIDAVKNRRDSVERRPSLVDKPM